MTNPKSKIASRASDVKANLGGDLGLIGDAILGTAPENQQVVLTPGTGFKVKKDVRELKNFLRLNNRRYVTFPHIEFYNLYMSVLEPTAQAEDRIRLQLADDRLLVLFGVNVVMVCYDMDFAPVVRENQIS